MCVLVVLGIIARVCVNFVSGHGHKRWGGVKLLAHEYWGSKKVGSPLKSVGWGGRERERGEKGALVLVGGILLKRCLTKL